MPYLETSVKLGDNVQEAFLQVAQVINKCPSLLEKSKSNQSKENGVEDVLLEVPKR